MNVQQDRRRVYPLVLLVAAMLAVFPGLRAEAIEAGPAARAQLLVLDGAKIAVRPNSRLLIEEFLYASGEPVPDGTPVGTLGIRGTDYTVLFCQDDCESAPEAGGSSLQNGLHVSVVDGIVVFRNEYGEIEITSGQKVVVPLTNRRPQRVGEPEETDGQDSGAGPRDDETPEIPIIGTDPDGNTMDLTDPKRNPGNRTISWSGGPTVFQSGFAGVQDNTPVEYVLDAGNDLEGFIGPHPDATGGVVRANFAIGAAGNVETGFDSVTMLRWGRWSGGTAGITLDTGADTSQDLSQQGLHWISSPEWMTPPVIPLSGAADYSLIGSTSPTNNLGEIGVVGSATFLADFTNIQVFNTLNLNIGQSIWFASGSGNIGARAGLPAHQFSGFYNNVTVDGFSTDFGFFSGFFSDPGNKSDPGLPGGVGLTYTLFDDLNQWVSGALVFGDPVPAAPPAGGGGP